MTTLLAERTERWSRALNLLCIRLDNMGDVLMCTPALRALKNVSHAPRGARTWRYKDIQFISSAGPFQLSITTLEKQFDFQLKQGITESNYNQLWLDIERKNGRIQ